MAAIGLNASLNHPDNGMSKEDMEACRRVADRSGEVIIFRSTGSWSLRWIERGYPTKNFHVKGKSSDWGPQAGFVPYEGRFSKVGAVKAEADKGTKANDDGLKDGYAQKVQLTLSLKELQLQASQRAGRPARLAIDEMSAIEGSGDFLLRCKRSGDEREFVFRAVPSGPGGSFQIFVYKEGEKMKFAALRYDAAVTNRGKPAGSHADKLEPLLVMTSSEVGANNRPMTGDYDLMAVCPRWSEYGATSTQQIAKPAVDFGGGPRTVGLTFAAGRGLDKVLDMRSNTGARPAGGGRDKTFQGLTKKDGGQLREHRDMGNVSGRILRCIVALNAEMPNGSGAFRRVHHNAESHRNHIFGAITGADMEAEGDGLPLTVFQPKELAGGGSPTAAYRDVATLETMSEFKSYASALHEAGYFVPRNWTWGMSVRDRLADFSNINTALQQHAQKAAQRG